MNENTQSSLAVLIDYENLALGTGKRKRNGHQEAGPRPDVKRDRKSTRLNSSHGS